ncbi:MAG TPA: metal-dependent hydrolase [Anaerolineales bacterium]|nr:metal-dependent hydrolase [Anaerolineales bacterium]
MPSPIAHLGVGYAIYRHYKNKLPEDQSSFWKLPLQLVMLAGLSLLPDLDVIPAIIFRDMQRYHNNFSHSLFFAIPVALLVAGIFRRVYRSNFWLWFVICLLSYDLHIIMDAFTAERGVMLFWPLSETRYASPVKLFYGLQWGLGWFSPWHLWTIFTESVFVGIVLIAMNYFDRRRNHAEVKRA